MMRRTAIEAVQRGIQALAANWPLILVHLLQTFVVSILFVAGAVPFVLVVGVASLRRLFESSRGGAADPLQVMDQAMAGLADSIGPLLLATLVALFVWTIAVVVYSYFQAGVFGVLASADARAVAPAPSRKDYSVFDLQVFRRAADRGLWTFFWLVNLFMLIGSAVLLALMLVVLLAAGLFAREWSMAAVSLGCLGGSAALVLAVATALWWQLAMASAASGRETVRQAMATSWRILVRRAGAVFVLALLAFVIGLTDAIALAPLSLLVELALGESLTAYIGSQIVISIVQSVFSAVISVGLAGVFVALVRGEIGGGEAPIG